MTVFEAIIIAIVEGLTEFLPISSTAHMRITENLLGISNTDSFTQAYTVAIQLGAILSVVVIYWRKFFNFSRWQFYVKLIVAVIPALIFGLIFSEHIDAVLESPLFIAIIMLAGGIFFLFTDRIFKHPVIDSEKKISYPKAFGIGLFQCLAVLLPGLSRSAATIIGGMSLKLTRSAAAEFSFFLAVPTMLAATVYKLYSYYTDNGGFTGQQVKVLAIGNLVAFIVALIAIKFFIGFVKKYGFTVWGWYRIALGIVLLVLIYMGYIK